MFSKPDAYPTDKYGYASLLLETYPNAGAKRKVIIKTEIHNDKLYYNGFVVPEPEDKVLEDIKGKVDILNISRNLDNLSTYRASYIEIHPVYGMVVGIRHYIKEYEVAPGDEYNNVFYNKRLSSRLAADLRTIALAMYIIAEEDKFTNNTIINKIKTIWNRIIRRK